MRSRTQRILGCLLPPVLAACLALTGTAAAADASIDALANQILASAEATLSSDASGSAGPQESAAQATASAAPQVMSAFRFSANPILPDNQIDAGVGYFYLRMEPGARQTLSVDVRNEGTEPVTIDMEVTPAMTNENGLIQYAQSTEEGEDASAFVRVSDVMTMKESEVTIAPMSSATVEVEIAMPEDAFDGTLLGGLVFTRQPDEAERSGGGMVVSSRYAYVLPVRLRETDAKILPEFALDAVKANEETPFGPRLTVAVRNGGAAIVKPLSLSCEVYREGSESPVLTHRNERIEMAPNTLMAYAIQQESALSPGEYVAKVSLTYRDTLYEYEERITVPEA